ncbi:transcriptional regulator, MarR family [Thermanaeromonas toyohensis ToBE]|uniref:Transcriptional regulator, MarR family n=1 Tax=Thermanaeromonas toyohensis ToBE TaxID=698762 RepID=A0A1W1V8P0_9FIRM|nr:MarR family transcriptional regulator [Thermanaeromonas toyohensis]SMB89837.1 transcriptional regulator, MarR family [Thermanaeromonas toyohensis ToBE]
MRYIRLLELLGRIHGRLARRLAPAFYAEDLSGTEMIVLWKVAKKGPWRVSELASFLGIPPSTFTGILDRLVARGLVERVMDPADRRSFLVRGTPSLKQVLERVASRVEEILDKTLSGWPEEEYRILIKALEGLDRYLDQPLKE